MLLFYNENRPVEWVMGQIDATDARTVFGALVDTYGLSYFRWENEVTGLLATGEGHGGTCANRIIGTDGIIEVHHEAVRLLRKGRDWEEVELEVCDVPGGATTVYLLDAIDCLLEGRKSILDSKNALQATELIFATYESSRRRGRIFLPLDSEDSALISMVEAGQIPWGKSE
jgi:predicted dehydrogenase